MFTAGLRQMPAFTIPLVILISNQNSSDALPDDMGLPWIQLTFLDMISGVSPIPRPAPIRTSSSPPRPEPLVSPP